MLTVRWWLLLLLAIPAASALGVPAADVQALPRGAPLAALAVIGIIAAVGGIVAVGIIAVGSIALDICNKDQDEKHTRHAETRRQSPSRTTRMLDSKLDPRATDVR